MLARLRSRLPGATSGITYLPHITQSWIHLLDMGHHLWYKNVQIQGISRAWMKIRYPKSPSPEMSPATGSFFW